MSIGVTLKSTQVQLECYLTSISQRSSTDQSGQKFDIRNWIWLVKKYFLLRRSQRQRHYCEPALMPLPRTITTHWIVPSIQTTPLLCEILSDRFHLFEIASTIGWHPYTPDYVYTAICTAGKHRHWCRTVRLTQKKNKKQTSNSWILSDICLIEGVKANITHTLRMSTVIWGQWFHTFLV